MRPLENTMTRPNRYKKYGCGKKEAITAMLVHIPITVI
jgi:hypothetical protein